MTLDERKRKILESIVKDYVETAEPVGSRAVVKKYALNISSATVRNEMADLEDMGYLEQPHTSSGRIPSETGFRYYVDYIMEKQKLSDTEIDLLNQLIDDNADELNEFIGRIGYFLSQVTNYASFVVVPSVKFKEFRSIQLVPLEKEKALILLVTDTGMIIHRKIDVPGSVEQEDLEQIGRIFNQVLKNKKINGINRSDLQYLRESLKQKRRIVDRALQEIDYLLKNNSDERLLVSGTLNILNEPEFKDLDKLRRILTLLEASDGFKDLIPSNMSEEVDITIGHENKTDDIKDLSLVYAGYKSFGEPGTIGLIGPVRMEYWKAAGTVEAVRSAIEKALKLKK
ncbi:MAG TPA: heat-inducible transcriptional repressor HrcA [Syntrophomonadaceae bacterium]|nr:heat-inducible transcriptional repressor HrcA [Syntrophomonadaceae bacterium]HNX29206.1 heat-inducible transcriptional repressor HrcA [Syntrophomonadaceae bacterium]HPR92574.1 heat-inducible transcriptional repressor HrcA [Syntrophomonadaceae bacterium]